MTAFLIEVPAHVQHVDHVSNQVQVRGGTNWDLSRSAVETPITPVAAPQPIRPAAEISRKYLPEAGSGPSQVTVHFGLNSVLVPASAQKLLKQIPKGAEVTITGHSATGERNPATTAEKRANAVARYLRKRGAKVESIKGLSTHVPTQSGEPKTNRRVEVKVQ